MDQAANTPLMLLKVLQTSNPLLLNIMYVQSIHLNCLWNVWLSFITAYIRYCCTVTFADTFLELAFSQTQPALPNWVAFLFSKQKRRNHFILFVISLKMSWKLTEIEDLNWLTAPVHKRVRGQRDLCHCLCRIKSENQLFLHSLYVLNTTAAKNKGSPSCFQAPFLYLTIMTENSRFSKPPRKIRIL